MPNEVEDKKRFFYASERSKVRRKRLRKR